MTEDEAEALYEDIKKFAAANAGPVSGRRIRAITFPHRGKTVTAEVGKHDPVEGEMVLAILESVTPGPYLICTPNRGVLKDVPIMVGAHEAKSVVDFDS
jgi:hypothetical protein